MNESNCIIIEDNGSNWICVMLWKTNVNVWRQFIIIEDDNINEEMWIMIIIE